MGSLANHIMRFICTTFRFWQVFCRVYANSCTLQNSYTLKQPMEFLVQLVAVRTPTLQKKDLLFWQLYFSPELPTVAMVLWEDTTTVPHDDKLWAIQCTWSIVATGTIEFATKAGKIAWISDKCCMQQKGIVPSQRSLSCELHYNYLCSKKISQPL